MSRCAQRDAFHTGAWRYCPWCGSELAAKPRRSYGVCRFCGVSVAPERRSCEPCWYTHVAIRDLAGHTLAELAALVAAGASWKAISARFGLRLRRGPRDARMAGFWFWKAAGLPGEPPRPDLLEHGSDCRGRVLCGCPEIVAWQAAYEDAMRRWLVAQAPPP